MRDSLPILRTICAQKLLEYARIILQDVGKMTRVYISTCLEPSEHAKIQEHHWKVPDLIRLGIKAREGNPQMILRIRELEGENARLVEKIDRLAKRLYELEVK